MQQKVGKKKIIRSNMETVEIKKATDKGVHNKKNPNEELSKVEFGTWNKNRNKLHDLMTHKVKKNEQ
jgi:hypothetical protein